MKKLKPIKMWFIALMLIAFFGAQPIASNAQSQNADVSAPMVSATTPENGAIAVNLNQAIAVTFSQEMSAPSIDMSLMLLGPDGSQVSGTVNSHGGTAVFVPSANLEAGTTYSATVTPEASGVAGAALADTYGWSFTTGAVIDSTTPTVSATSPLDHAINVPVNQRVLAMFSKKMTPASLNRVTFKVTKPGGVAIMGVVTYASGAVSLKPRYALAPNTHYIATITTGEPKIYRAIQWLVTMYGVSIPVRIQTLSNLP